jgi:phosphatidylglycerophosphatase C
VIVSASPDLYIRPWAAALGVERVLASRLAFEDGRCTGALIGANCFGPEKVRRLELEFGALRHGAIHAYGDSPGDREMLARATHGHYRRFHARRAGAGRSFLRAMLRPPAGAA